MKALLIVTALFGTITPSQAQNSDRLKARFLQELQSGDVEEGCKLVVVVVNASLNASCFVPETFVSKVACAAGEILNATSKSALDPNVPNPISDAEVRICQLTYVTIGTGIEYTFEFSKNQAEEVQQTWNWLNSLEGVIQFMEYISR